MRIARAVAMLALGLGGAVAGASVAAAQVAPPADAWVVTTDPHHASCLPQALPRLPMAIRVDGKVGTVVVDVDPARIDCERVAERLLAFGVETVAIDGVTHALLDLRVRCRVTRERGVRWALSLAEFQLEEQRLWERLERGLAADELGSTDVKAARALAAACPRMIAEVLAPAGLDTSAISAYRRLPFTHGAWTGTLDDLRRQVCPRLAATAERIRRRASLVVRLEPARAELFATSPDGWYVPGARTRTVDPAILLRARVWIQVEDATLDDLVDGHCPPSEPVVTRYIRYTFDARGAIVDRRTTIDCAAFSPAMLR